MINKYDGSLYNYQAGTSCGVLMKESTMKKLVKLQAKHLDAVKKLLLDEAERENVFPYMWTLHYPNGKQTTVTYIDKSRDVIGAIKAATLTHPPKHKPLVFIAETMEEAASMADEYASFSEDLLSDNHEN